MIYCHSDMGSARQTLIRFPRLCLNEWRMRFLPLCMNPMCMTSLVKFDTNWRTISRLLLNTLDWNGPELVNIWNAIPFLQSLRYTCYGADIRASGH